MKKLFISFIAIVAIACSKHVPQQNSTSSGDLEIWFDGTNQINVESYRIEVADSTLEFKERGILFPGDKLNESFYIKIHLKEVYREMYYRIRTVDKDKKFVHSTIVII